MIIDRPHWLRLWDGFNMAEEGCDRDAYDESHYRTSPTYPYNGNPRPPVWSGGGILCPVGRQPIEHLRISYDEAVLRIRVYEKIARLLKQLCERRTYEPM